MQQRFIRIRELTSEPGRSGVLPVSRSTLWRWVKTGSFPRPVQLGPMVTAWPVEVVEKFLADRQHQQREAA